MRNGSPGPSLLSLIVRLRALVLIVCIVGVSASCGSHGDTDPDAARVERSEPAPVPTAEPSGTSGGLGCVDAEPRNVVVDDDAAALFADSEKVNTVVDSDLEAHQVDLGVTDFDEGVLGGDGRIWFVTQEDQVVVFDPRSGSLARGPELPPYSGAVGALASTADGAVLVSQGQLRYFSGSPVEEVVHEVDAIDDDADVYAASPGPDGLLWAVSGDEAIAMDDHGEVVISADHEGSQYVQLFVGEGCAVMVDGCPTHLTVVDRNGVADREVDGSCGTAAARDGVVWIGGRSDVIRVDLATGASVAAPAFDCGDGAALFAGPGGVVAVDSCDLVAVRLDPATGQVIDRLSFADRVSDPADAYTWGSWPWAVIEDLVFHLPSLEPVDTVVETSEGAYFFRLAAVLPPG